ncbi:hypothetical protein DPEC_G00173120 [Dallia pectoralis]|uniref:Uncharacterized protein n=1 Tax=Dallia pectoralis TaxID=75939 RepID=A0ACC2GE75_DALPE|nr:hypothetical protein DPEC_G00173120 [Dallia pectoralis]
MAVKFVLSLRVAWMICLLIGCIACFPSQNRHYKKMASHETLQAAKKAAITKLKTIWYRMKMPQKMLIPLGLNEHSLRNRGCSVRVPGLCLGGSIRAPGLYQGGSVIQRQAGRRLTQGLKGWFLLSSARIISE